MLVPVRGSPTITQGPAIVSSRTSGCPVAQLCRASRLASARCSILATRNRPNGVSSASVPAGRDEDIQRLAVAVAAEVVTAGRLHRGG